MSIGITTWASPNGIEVGIERPRSSITDYRVFRFRGQDRLWTSHENSNVESSETRGPRSSIDFLRRYKSLELRRSWPSIDLRWCCYYLEPRSIPEGPCAMFRAHGARSALPESFVKFAQVLEASKTKNPFNFYQLSDF